MIGGVWLFGVVGRDRPDRAEATRSPRPVRRSVILRCQRRPGSDSTDSTVKVLLTRAVTRVPSDLVRCASYELLTPGCSVVTRRTVAPGTAARAAAATFCAVSPDRAVSPPRGAGAEPVELPDADVVDKEGVGLGVAALASNGAARAMLARPPAAASPTLVLTMLNADADIQEPPDQSCANSHTKLSSH